MAQTANGRHIDVVENINLNALQGTTIAIDGKSAVYELGDRAALRFVLAVTAVSTDDTMVVKLETSRDGVNNWYAAWTSDAIADTATLRVIAPIDRFIRMDYDVTGSDVAIVATCTGEAV